MPIKFRCSSCRQFLGISRQKAGGVVNCPTCGRSIRVPELDGTVAPLREPELNTADAQLAHALDELAALAHLPDKPTSAAASGEGENESPQPLPEPIPVEIPIPVSVEPLVPSLPPAEQAPLSRDLGLVLADLAQESPQLPSAEVPAGRSNIVAPLVIPAWVAWAPVAAALLGVGLGWLLGHETSGSPDAPAVETQTVLAVPNVSVRGRISSVSATGTIVPDEGATVLAIPVGLQTGYRFPPAGLRPADQELDRAVVAAAATALGGGMATADQQGEYRMELAQPGPCHWLVLSRLAQRAEDSDWPQDALVPLREILADPAATVGRRPFSMAQREAKAGRNDAWDHQFAP